MPGLLTTVRALPARTRGAIYVGAGLLLAVIGAALINAFAGGAADAGVEVATAREQKAVGLLGAPFALAMAAGVVLTYVGVVKLALGARTDRLAWDRLTGVGLLYVLGFIGALILVGYVVLVRWELHIF